jgi:hypothetical protein
MRLLVLLLLLVMFVNVESAVCNFTQAKFTGRTTELTTLSVLVTCNPGELADTINVWCDKKPGSSLDIQGQPCGQFSYTCNFTTMGVHNSSATFNNNTYGSPATTCTYQGSVYVYADVYAPPILSFQTNSSTDTSITVNWTTDAPADSYLNTSFDQVYWKLASSSTLTTDHTLTATGLTSNLTYYYQITSCNQGGCSPPTPGRINTQPEPAPTPGNGSANPTPTLPPQYDNDVAITALNIPSMASTSDTGVDVSYTVENKGKNNAIFSISFRDNSASGSVAIPQGNRDFSLAAGLSQVGSFRWPFNSISTGVHTVTATVLFSADQNPGNNIQTTTIAITPPSTAPVISGVQATGITLNSATISWTTNVVTNSEVFYGINRPGTNPKSSSQKVTAHSIALTGLLPNTNYIYFVRSCTDSTCTRFPADAAETLSFNTQNPTQACAIKNACNGSTYVTYKDDGGKCVVDREEKCIASGCFAPTCSVTEGCGVRDMGTCKETCSSTVLLKSPVNCFPDDTNPKKGICQGTDFTCDASQDFVCSTGSVACGGANYFCVKDEAKYEWRKDNSACMIQAPSDNTTNGAYKITAAEPSRIPESIGTPFDLNSDEYDQTITKAMSGKRNIIDAVAIDIEPFLWDKDKDTVHFYIVTNSQSDLSIIECGSGKDSESKCFCEAGYQGKKANFKCDVLPPSIGNYTITLVNGQNEAGKMLVELIPGKKASVYKVVVPDRESQIIFYFAVGLGLLLVLVVMGVIITNSYRERTLGKKVSRDLVLLPKQQEMLKARYMKGMISAEELQRANGALEKRKAELEAAKLEWQKRHPKKKQGEVVAGAIEVEDEPDEDELEKIPERLKKKTVEKKANEGAATENAGDSSAQSGIESKTDEIKLPSEKKQAEDSSDIGALYEEMKKKIDKGKPEGK